MKLDQLFYWFFISFVQTIHLSVFMLILMFSVNLKSFEYVSDKCKIRDQNFITQQR